MSVSHGLSVFSGLIGAYRYLVRENELSSKQVTIL